VIINAGAGMSQIQPNSQNEVSEKKQEAGEEEQKEIFVQVSEPAKVSSQSDLNSVAERHRLWMEEVLNPKSDSATGRASFRKVDLRGFSLKGMDLRCADFSGAILDGCDMSHANLSGCSFKDTSMREADLRGARLKNAVFSGPDLVVVAHDPGALDHFLAGEQS